MAGGTDGATVFSDCEIYNPSTGVWTEVASLSTGRFNHTAILLNSGQVLVAGGRTSVWTVFQNCEDLDRRPPERGRRQQALPQGVSTTLPPCLPAERCVAGGQTYTDRPFRL